MLPIRSSTLRRGRVTPLISSLSRSIAGPSTSTPRRLPSSVSSIAATAPLVQSRQLHTSASLFKDKRWVNSAAEDEGKKTKKGKESKSVSQAQDDSAEVKEGASESSAETTKSAEDETRPAEAKSEAKEAKVEASSASSGASSTSSPGGNGNGNGNGDGKSSGKEIAKLNIPEVYPQILALPITLRPLFPTFYKAVTVTHPPVIKAIRELMANGQPYIGAFLFKDSESNADVITSLDQVHPVGVFAQITSSFEPPDKAKGGKETQPGGEELPKALTVVLYPHRRIRIDELVHGPIQDGESVPIAKVVEEVQKGESDVVASFEPEVPSVDAVREELGTTAAERPEESLEPKEATEGVAAPPQSSIGFLHPLLPDITISNVSNYNIQPYRKDTQMIRALMAELISSFKDLAQLAPIFRDQSE